MEQRSSNKANRVSFAHESVDSRHPKRIERPVENGVNLARNLDKKKSALTIRVVVEQVLNSEPASPASDFNLKLNLESTPFGVAA